METSNKHPTKADERAIEYCVPEIRWLREDEAEAHRKFLDEAFAPFRAIYTPKPEPPRNTSRTARTVVTVMEGHIVGAVSYYPKEQFVRLFALAVGPNHRRRGIARALIQWVADNACSKTHPELGLYTIEETGNAVIFERMGFRVISRRVAVDAVSPSGGPVHELDMISTPTLRG